MKNAFLALFGALVTVHLTAQPTLVKDLRTAPAGIFGGSDRPSDNFPLFAAGELMFFPAVDQYGMEVWRTDGTEQGTFRISDVNPGPTSSYQMGAVLDGDFIFATLPGTWNAYPRLWKTDGTNPPVSLGDLTTGTQPYTLNAILPFGDKLLLVVSAGNKISLLQCDGTGAPTAFKELVDDAAFVYSSVTNLGGQFAIEIQKSVGFDVEYHVWKTDGTLSGTLEVGTSPYSPANAAKAGNHLLFKDDGGTTLLKMNLSTGQVSTAHDFSGNFINRVLAYDETRVLVATNSGLFVSDGTSANTLSILPGVGTIHEAFVAAGKAYFKGISTGDNKDRLYETDGTSAGTKVLAITGDLNNYSLFEGHPTIVQLGDQIICRMNTPGTGSEIASVSLSGGGQIIKDIYVGSSPSLPNSFSLFNGDVYFVANDGVNGFELWKTNGTSAGTTLVKNAVTGSSDGITDNALFALNGEIYFTGGNKTSPWLWRTTGQGANAEEVIDLLGGSMIAASPDTLFLLREKKIYKTNNAAADTILIEDLSDASFVTVNKPQDGNFFLGETLVYGLTTAGGAFSYGSEYWKANGRVDGSTVLKDIYAGLQDGLGGTPDATRNRSIPISGSKALFNAASNATGKELWVTDGTTAGTILVKDINIGTAGSDPDNMTAVLNGSAYFSADDGIHGRELWKSDGTDAGTLLVKDVDVTGSAVVSNVVVMDNMVYFTAHSDGWSLFKTDGTSAGTTKIKTLNTLGKSEQGPTAMIAIDHKLYISASDATAGHELWVSDGTTAGTMVLDLVPGSAGSRPGNFYSFNNELYFAADNHLWHTKGTVLLTEKIDDINPVSFHAVGDQLYIIAVSAQYGKELFRMPAKKYTQTIDFTAIGTRTMGTGDFQLVAQASSGLPLTFTSASDKITISGSTVSLVSIGEVTVKAAQAGDVNYAPAFAEQKFCIVDSKPTITVTTPAPFTAVLQSSKTQFNAWYLNGVLLEGASESTYTITKSGTYTLKIVSGSCESEASAPQVIEKFAQTITLNIAARKFEDGNFTLTGSSSSGLPLTYSSTSERITLTGDLVQVKAAGPVTITASTAGTDLIAPATFSRTFCINPPKPSITSAASGNQVVLTSSADSNNQWYVDNTLVAGAVAKTIMPVQTGAYTVEVNVEGCKTSSDPLPVVVTGLEDGATSATLYPTPVDTDLTIVWPARRVQVQIVNSLGQAVGQTEFYESTTIDVRSYSRDIYFVRLASDDEVVWKRFVRK